MKRQYLEDACESIDAALFTGDLLYDHSELSRLKEYLGRWERAIQLREAQDTEEGAEDAPQQCEPLTDEQIDRAWLQRDCIEAIQAGDILAQVRCVVRAIESTRGIKDGSKN